MNASAANGLAAQLELEAQLMQEAGRTADYEEGVRAFLEKRTPRYQGR
jgi:2-(1,2-epoxy-1,2-dihydrophenyl)acetyl-CoA isomerase